jgi:bla regulator protein BlaR1
MNATINIAESAFRLVVQTTWQAAVVAGLILLAHWLFRKRLTPAWRYGLWFLLVARLLMPASFPSTLSIFNLAKVDSSAPPRDHAQPPPTVSTLSDSFASAKQSELVSIVATYSEPLVQTANEPGRARTPVETEVYQSSHRPPAWLAVAVLLWLSGVFTFGLRLIWSNLRFCSRLAQHPRIEDGPVVRLFDDCARSLGLRGHVALIETDEVESPAVYGLWHKRVLLPEGFSERFSGDELRCVFMHELAHLKRYDLEINGLVSVLQVLHWFNPTLWFAFSRMRADRELACDALAMLRMGSEKRLAYGETILKLLESLTRPPAVSGLLGISEDKRRSPTSKSPAAGPRRHWC